MIQIDISDSFGLQAIAANMKREAVFEAKGESNRVGIDSLINNCLLFNHEKVPYSLILSIDSNSKGRYWHLSIGSVSESKPIPPDDLCFYIVENVLGEGRMIMDTDPRRPNVRHFLKEIV
jgi:hypothetical protein